MQTINISDIPELLIKSPLFETFIEEETITIPKRYFSTTIFSEDGLHP